MGARDAGTDRGWRPSSGPRSRASRDGGRDANGPTTRLGPPAAARVAKCCYQPGNSVGVCELFRLISRISSGTAHSAFLDRHLRPTKRSATTGTPSSPSRRADLATIPKAPHRTFPPSPPAPLPSLVHGEITFIQGNSSTTTNIPLGTVVHLRVDSRRYDTPNSTDPLVLTPSSPPGVLADFRAVGLAGAVTGQGVRVDGDALGRVYLVLRRGCGLRDAVPGVLDEVGGLVGGCC